MIVPNEEVDTDKLREWLRGSGFADVHERTVVMAQRLPGGYSNLTYDLKVGSGAAARHVVLRRPPVGVTADRGAHDMCREFRVLRTVHGTGVPVPEPIALCEDESVLGAKFFLMSKVEGVAVRRLSDAPALRDEAEMRRMSEACVDAMAALHELPVTETPLYDAERAATYGARQVANWHARWSAACPPDLRADDAEFVFEWLRAYLPEPIAPALLHNDWKFDNLLVDPVQPSRITGVLDWEMATVGDPRFDLATSLGYWVQPDDPAMLQALALGVTNAPGCLTRAEVVARYAVARGVPIEDPVYWWAFGLAKVGVIVVQLYARYVAGTTRDPRYALLGGMATLLMSTARSAIERQSLSTS
ncbi:MAG: phosphotransferase family protein [Gemmatimonadaceae bacterium]|nr:phosphotransferase family protein [Gemmatimonadaceae bacterium]